MFSNAIALLLGETTEVGSLGQILADETVGVLVGAAFPSMVWRCKIDLRIQDALQFQVAMKLGAIVRRDGLDPVTFRPLQLDRPIQRQILGGAVNRPHP